MFCSLKTLRNEKAVEKNFVYRLIERLGYPDDAVRVDEAVEELEIPRGRNQERHRPDVVLFAKKIPRIIVESKHPKENPIRFLYQAVGYALMLNQRYEGINPLKYCILTNGISTHIFFWDSAVEFLFLSFEEWSTTNTKAVRVFDLLCHERFVEEFWSTLPEIPTNPLAEAVTLLHGEAISRAAVTRLLYISKAHPDSFGPCFDNIWHRKAYSELVNLGWVEPEEVDKEHYELLMSGKNVTEFAYSRAVGFVLTELGKEVVQYIYRSPDLISLYHGVFQIQRLDNIGWLSGSKE